MASATVRTCDHQCVPALTAHVRHSFRYLQAHSHVSGEVGVLGRKERMSS